MIDLVKQMPKGQFEASLSMLDDCVRKCPDEHWRSKIANYDFWHVAYHTLCFTDYYFSPSEGAFKPGAMHPAGVEELNTEYPSREFSRDEILDYVGICHHKGVDTLARETEEILAAESGFARRKTSRGELHVYNIRYIQHHAGQLSAFLRKADVDTAWFSSGWR